MLVCSLAHWRWRRADLSFVPIVRRVRVARCVPAVSFDGSVKLPRLLPVSLFYTTVGATLSEVPFSSARMA